MSERWKNIKGFPTYQVSDQGAVRNTRFGRRLKPGRGPKGYKTIPLYRDGIPARKSLNSLVAEAFLGPKPKGQWVYFKNGDPGDCRALNLEYRPSASHPRSRGSDHYSARLTEADVRKIRRRHRRGGVTLTALAGEYGLTRQAIHAVVTRKTWKHVED